MSNNVVFTVTDVILDDENLDPNDGCNCYVHAAITERLDCVYVDDVCCSFESVNIGGQEIQCSTQLREWQHQALGLDIDQDDVEPIDIVWDEKLNLLYIEGEELYEEDYE